MRKYKKRTSYSKLKKLPLNQCPYQEIINDQLCLFTDKKPYTPVANCIIEHIITTSNLSNYEKLYYLLADNLSIINKNQGGKRSCALAATHWAKNLNCSRSLVFAIQKSLQEKGYFILEKDFTVYGLNKRNIITPTVPEHIFNHLNEKYPNKAGELHLPYNHINEGKRDYLDRTKLFIRINYHLLKEIVCNDLLNTQQKIIWLGFYNRGYKNFNRNGNFSFVASYQELTSFYSFSYKIVSKSVATLSRLGFIKANNFYIRENVHCNTEVNYIDNCILSARKDKSLWEIVISLPDNYSSKLVPTKDRSSVRKKSKTDIITKTVNKKKISTFNLNAKVTNLVNSRYIAQSEQNNSLVLSVNNKFNDKQTDKFNKQSDIDCSLSQSISDPTLPKSRPHINKDSKLKNSICNLWGKPKVLLRDFIQKITTKSDSSLSSLIKVKNSKKETRKLQSFNITTELIKEKLKLLPEDKADKARRFAHKLITKKLATGYAASLTINELAKELICHAATWKPTRLGKLSKEKEVDIALTVAWKYITKGQWQSPLELVKVNVLQYEFKHYKEKYRLSGTISPELKDLALDTEKLVGKWYDLETKIKSEIILNQNENKGSNSEKPLISLASNIKNSNGEINLPELKEKKNTNQQNALYSIDLPTLSDKQKYLSISGTNSEMIEIATTDNHQFYGKLKSIELNENGELIMTLRPKTQQQFFERYNINNFNPREETREISSSGKGNESININRGNFSVKNSKLDTLSNINKTLEFLFNK